jgi:hypothetical protein
MFVTYAPEDGDRQEWTFNPGRVRASEGQALLREYGEKAWDLFVQAIRQNDLHARRVLLWHLTRRAHPLMKFADTPDFFADEMTVEFSSDELAELRDKVANSPAPPDQKAQALAVFEAEMEVALKREAEGADLGGKAPTPTSSTEPTTTG